VRCAARPTARCGVRVENDATCAGWGEKVHGAAVGIDNLVLVTLGGQGFGGGIILDGQVFGGAYGFAGEIGHMVVDPNGPPCPCGNRGCWERYASGSGLGRLAREAANAGRAARVVELAGGDPEDVKGEHVTIAAGENDEGAMAGDGELRVVARPWALQPGQHLRSPVLRGGRRAGDGG